MYAQLSFTFMSYCLWIRRFNFITSFLQDIDLKSLLYEAYYKGAQELLFVVPFVAKVIESCSKSKVFKPPNPWTMGIMNVLAELHQVDGLKLNLKFEIEVLCKTLSLDINVSRFYITGNLLKNN